MNAASDRRSGTGTANYILIRLLEQVLMPLYRFLHFLERRRRWYGCTKKNCFKIRQLHAGIRLPTDSRGRVQRITY